MNTPTKRHCMVVHAYYPLGEIRVQREAKALIDAGFEVDVISLRRPSEASRASEYGVQIYRLPVKRHKRYGALWQLVEYMAFFFLASWQLLKLHLKRRYSTIQVHNLPDFLVFSALIPKLLGVRIILDLHDLMPEFYAARFRSDLNSFPVKLVQFQEKISCWFADHVITVTKAWRQSLIERGVPADKCSVVMNLPDLDIFQIEKNGSSGASSANGLVQLFYHGNISYRYGLDNLVKAFKQAYSQLPNIRLTIHGRGDFQPKLEGLINELGLNQVVTLSTELIPLEDVATLIETADLAVVPYRPDKFTDGILPTKLMEYAAMGISTIASNTTAIRSYFDDEMVYFVTPDDVPALTDAIIQVAGDKKLLELLSENISRFNQIYNWPGEAQNYVQFVNKLIDEPVNNNKWY